MSVVTSADPFLAMGSILGYRTLRWTATAHGPMQPSGGWSSDLRSGVGAALAGGPDFHCLFEPPMPEREPPRGLRGSKDAPRPLVFFGPYPSRLPLEGGTVRFGLTTFVTDDQSARRLAQAVSVACHIGVGEPRRRLHLDSEDLGSASNLRLMTETRWSELGGGNELLLRVGLQTPLHIRRNGAPVEPTFSEVTASLIRRIEHLAWMFEGEGLGCSSLPLQLASDVDAAADTRRSLRWVVGERKSKRQRARVPLRGHLGWLEARVPRELGWVLLAGEVLHAGKDAVQGLGRLGLKAAEPLTSEKA
jgi:hypothetical protein